MSYFLHQEVADAQVAGLGEYFAGERVRVYVAVDERQAIDKVFDLLHEESARHGARIMAISLHPWAIGQPYRIGALESALAHMMRQPGVWPATGAEILDAWKAQRAAQGNSAA